MKELASIKGTNGVLFVFEDHVVISAKSTMGFLRQGFKGDREIYFNTTVRL